MVIERVHQMTVAEYLAFEESSDIKNEFIDGELYPMTGGSLNHSRIIMNAGIEIGLRLRDTDCAVLSSDMRVRVGPARFVYPDLSVVCGEPETEYNTLTLLNPTLVVEVTSPSSIDYDRGTKRKLYGDVPSIAAYLVIDQHRALVELYTRIETGWQLQCFADLDDVVPLEALDCDLPLREIYRDIAFEPEARTEDS